MGTQNGYNVSFVESASLRKRKRKAMKRIKQIYKISKKSNKKNHAINIFSSSQSRIENHTQKFSSSAYGRIAPSFKIWPSFLTFTPSKTNGNCFTGRKLESNMFSPFTES